MQVDSKVKMKEMNENKINVMNDVIYFELMVDLTTNHTLQKGNHTHLWGVNTKVISKKVEREKCELSMLVLLCLEMGIWNLVFDVVRIIVIVAIVLWLLVFVF